MSDYQDDFKRPERIFRADFAVPMSDYYGVQTIMEVDEEHGLLRVLPLDDYDESEHIHRFGNFHTYSVTRNKQQVGGSSGSLLYGAAGYALGGAVGAVIGYLVGAEAGKEVCTELELCLHFSDGAKTEHIKLIDEYEQVNDFEYEERVEALKECLSVLEAIKAVNSGEEDSDDIETIAGRIREELAD